MDVKNWFRNPEMIIALCALMISIITAFTSIYSAYVDRAYAKASVWPRLELGKSSSDRDLYFNINVTNSGTGPAIIKYAKLSYKGEYIKRWADIELFDNLTQSHIGTRVISPQQQILPIQYKGDNFEKIMDAYKHINFELCYCSIYEECWVINWSQQPKPVEACFVSEEHRFGQ